MQGLFFEGFLLQASLIFALGAQNIFVLESGLKKQHPLIISFVCFLCDFLLIMIGVAGVGSFFSAFSQLKIFIGAIGVIFLVQYGFSKIFLPLEVFQEEKNHAHRDIRRSILLAMTFSVLNPHAYLDAFILIGGHSSKYAVLSERLWVGAGAAIYSLVWFLFLTQAAGFIKPLFSNPRSLRILSTCTGLLLLLLSFRLGQDVYSWISQGPHSPILVKSIPYPAPRGLVYSTILY